MSLARKLKSAVHMIRADPRGFLRYLAGRCDRMDVFAARTAAIPVAAAIPGAEFHAITDEELLRLPPPELAEQQSQRRRNFGFNESYAVLHHGNFAHISWVIRYENDSVNRPRLLGLQPGEAEITACVTLPEFRGLGLYPFAIRSICARLSQTGIHTVFMKTRPGNLASQRGILKAGLQPCGRVTCYSLPYATSMEGIVFRGHRRVLARALTRADSHGDGEAS